MARELFSRIGKKTITSTGVTDLLIPGTASADRIKGLICWYSSYPEGRRESADSLGNETHGAWYFAAAHSSSEGASGNGALMHLGAINENNLGTSNCAKYTDSAGGPGELRALVDPSATYSFAANVLYTLVPTIGGTQVAGPINNGWRINVTTLAVPSVFFYFALVYGRDTEVIAKPFQIPNSAGTDTTLHELTNPKKILGLIVTTGRETDGGTFENAIRNGFGAFYWDGTTITQGGVFTRWIDGAGTPFAKDTFSQSSIIHYLEGAIDWEARVSAVDATNITFETITAPAPDSVGGSVSNERGGMFLISIPEDLDGWVGTFRLPSTSGAYTIPGGPSFKPTIMGILATGSDEIDLEMNDQKFYGNWSYGMVDYNLTQGCTSFIQDGNVDTGNTTSSSVALPRLVYSYYHNDNEGDITDITELCNITVATDPFVGGNVTFPDAEVSGTHGGWALGFAIQGGEDIADDEVPVIDGRPIVGETLAVDTECIDALLGVGYYAFQWYRDGIPIEGATESEYTLTADDFGHHITVEVTFTDTGGDIIRISSGATGAIRVRTKVGLTTPQGAFDTGGNKPSPEVVQWMNRVSSAVSNLERSGGTAERPVKDLYPGLMYYDTTLQHAIWYSGFDNVWHDSAGNEV
jgi:hypothetical protein